MQGLQIADACSNAVKVKLPTRDNKVYWELGVEEVKNEKCKVNIDNINAVSHYLI